MRKKKGLPRAGRRVLSAAYVEEACVLVVTTSFIGPDGLRRAFNVNGVPDVEYAKRFMAHMGWQGVPVKLFEVSEVS